MYFVKVQMFGTLWMLARRYSDFYAYFQKEEECRRGFPTRRIFLLKRRDVIAESRREALEMWLNAVLRHKYRKNWTDVRDFWRDFPFLRPGEKDDEVLQMHATAEEYAVLQAWKTLQLSNS